MTRYTYEVDGEIIGSYNLTPLPGCSQVAVSHDLFVFPRFRGTGKARAFMAHRLKHAQDLGFDMVIATSDFTNDRQNKTLAQAEWKRRDYFRSSKTGHAVWLWVKNFNRMKVSS